MSSLESIINYFKIERFTLITVICVRCKRSIVKKSEEPKNLAAHLAANYWRVEEDGLVCNCCRSDGVHLAGMEEYKRNLKQYD